MGDAASGAPTGKRLQKDVEDKGHPFSFHEIKPLNLWQTILEHTSVTHVVDFSPGSGCLALAAAGKGPIIQYEGIASNSAHLEWLDSTLDKVVLYLCGKPDDTGPKMIKKLGGDAGWNHLFAKRCSGIMAEARRYCEPDVADGDGEGNDGESSDADSDD